MSGCHHNENVATKLIILQGNSKPVHCNCFNKKTTFDTSSVAGIHSQVCYIFGPK